jgi:16S rRNA (cytosine967-C5)-methyltransferase
LSANRGRIAAARALTAVDAEGAHIEEALAQVLPKGRDRSLGWFLAMGTLRRRAVVDAALQEKLKEPLPTLQPALRSVLRMSTYEKLFGRSQPHAVVHQAVEVARVIGVGRASGLVNAVIRRVATPETLSRPESLNHPAWLVSRWDARYGEDATSAWCHANVEQPPVTLVIPDETWVARMAVDGRTLSAVTLHGAPVPDVYRLAGHEGPIPALPGFEEGAFWVQDTAAVSVADLAEARPGLKVLDACAAPGGKSFRMASGGASVVCVDRDRYRLKKVRRGARRLGLTVETQIHSWTEGPGELGLFDVVVVDAPCSGIGTIRRHPDIKWRRIERDLKTAAALQLDILRSAATKVQTGGGKLIYAVCSSEPEEGGGVVADFMKENPAFSLERTFSTAPPEGGEDAHFAAVMVHE